MRLTLSILLLSCLGAFGASEILPSANDFQTQWKRAGVLGNTNPPPYRTTIATTLSPGVTTAAIETAVNTTAASNEVVKLANGTFSTSNRIHMTASGKTLRGTTNANGWPITILDFSNKANDFGLVDISKAGYPANNWAGVSSINITNGLTLGSTQIKVQGTLSGFTVGQMFIIDAHQDGTHVKADDSDQGVGVFSRNDDRPLMQVCRATNVSGVTVQFEPPLMTAYFNDAGIDCEMYWWDDNYSGTVRYTSLEDVVITRTVSGGSGTQHGVAIGPAYGVWCRNVIVSNVANGASGFRISWGLDCELLDCYESLHDDIGSGTYGYDLAIATRCRLWNSIGVKTPCMVAMRAASGCVVFGMYGTNFVYTDSSHMTETIMWHGSHCFASLVEATLTPKVISDYIHGDASYNTIHRSRLTGWESGKTGFASALALGTNSISFASIGNVLGSDNYHLNYDSGGQEIYDLEDADANAISTFGRYGNYNTVDDGIRAGESMGSSTNAYSYCFDGKPTAHGILPWPWVKATSTSDSLAPLQATNQPAGHRFLLGTFPPSEVAGGGSESSAITSTAILGPFRILGPTIVK